MYAGLEYAALSPASHVDLLLSRVWKNSEELSASAFWNFLGQKNEPDLEQALPTPVSHWGISAAGGCGKPRDRNWGPRSVYRSNVLTTNISIEYGLVQVEITVSWYASHLARQLPQSDVRPSLHIHLRNILPNGII